MPSFRKFAASHSSGEFEDHKLDDDDQPVVGITWEENRSVLQLAVEKRDGLPAFYRLENGQGGWLQSGGHRLSASDRSRVGLGFSP